MNSIIPHSLGFWYLISFLKIILKMNSFPWYFRYRFCHWGAVQLGVLWHYCIVTVHGGGLVWFLMLQWGGTDLVLDRLLLAHLRDLQDAVLLQGCPATGTCVSIHQLPRQCCGPQWWPWSLQASVLEQNKWWGVDSVGFSFKCAFQGRMRFAPAQAHQHYSFVPTPCSLLKLH